ncbi:toprim domain-containing protein [Pseudorhodobacter sp. E13]|uniref:toprim domain-containing protein n=1 Tax=Pseudorhodobacter sp. E13 TaxID=2487931 RepID=UPI0013159847|nr:toprim domain-containing protein [Pseudorhodobacter sp. E13]
MNKRTSDTVRLSPENLDEIRASIDWQALFTGLGLRKAELKSKPNDWWAFSPFHDEKTPSFHMAAGGIWYDFSIGEGGGPIELVQRLEGGNCYEAGRLILERGWAHASVDLSIPVTRHRDTVRRSVTKAVTTVTETVPTENDPIRQDLLKLCSYHETIAARGVSEATCDLLGIGYLPQGRSPLKGRIVFQVADARPAAKNAEEPSRVILSHFGRSIDGTEPKYLFYKGFHKSSELYAQELISLHEDAAAQISDTKAIVLTEGPFDVAKAVEAGLRNVVGSFGSSLSLAQAQKLKAMADTFGAETIHIIYDRDTAGREGAAKAVAQVEAQGLTAHVFDWDAPVTRARSGDVFIPVSVQDLADMSSKQIQWLRQRGQL